MRRASLPSLGPRGRDSYMNHRTAVVAVVLVSAITCLGVMRRSSATKRPAPHAASASLPTPYQGPPEQKQHVGWVFGRMVGVNADSMSPFRTSAVRGR